MQKEIEPHGQKLLKLTREHFLQKMADGTPVHDWFPHHVKEVEKWANKITDYYPEADREIVLLSVWLHDIGHFNKKNIEYHEIVSEKETRKFFGSLGVNKEKINKVAHCVRTHRCKEDAMPETTEAKILAAADSASHFTDIVYIDMLRNGSSKDYVLGKLDRDLRDIQSLPKELLNEIEPLYPAWKKLISAFPES